MNYRILLLSASWLGVSAGSVPLTGCACTEVACGDGVNVLIDGTNALGTSSAELVVTLGKNTFQAHVDFASASDPKCTPEIGSGWMCVGVGNEIQLIFGTDDAADSTRLYLTLTTADGAVVAHYNGIVETPVVHPNGVLCGTACREGSATITVNQPT